MDKLFQPTLCSAFDYLSMLGLRLNHVSKSGCKQPITHHPCTIHIEGWCTPLGIRNHVVLVRDWAHQTTRLVAIPSNTFFSNTWIYVKQICVNLHRKLKFRWGPLPVDANLSVANTSTIMTYCWRWWRRTKIDIGKLAAWDFDGQRLVFAPLILET